MKNLLVLFTLSILFSNASFAIELCGQLYEHCNNERCSKTITPHYCFNGTGPCLTGDPVSVVPENNKAREELDLLLERKQGIYVCTEGATDELGIFHVSSAIAR